MRKALFVTAAVLAAVFFFLLVTLPPAPYEIEAAAAGGDLARRTVAGGYHVHTTRSDGAEDKASVAAAAKRAGLKFVIFTDHGDGTRPPDPPTYIDGVLCLDGVEISTNGGHYVALDMPAAPYPLGGEAAAVVEDVARFGGFGVAAHVHSAKADLAWMDWRAPIDGIEWLNVDSDWRDESTTRLARVLFDYIFRPAPAIASILDRPEATLERWATLSRHRRVVALAALDAHGGVRRQLEGSRRIGAGPSYEASFRTVSNRAVLQRPLSGDAATDGRAVMDAIRHGRVYAAIDALAAPALVDPAAPIGTWAVPRGAKVVAMGGGGTAGWYEVQLARAPGTPPVPWLLTNPIASPDPQTSAPAAPLGEGKPVAPEWRIEKDPASTGAVEVAPDGTAAVTYRLRAGERASQFVALAGDLAGGVAAEQIVFDASAAQPMRLSVQLRFPRTEERWLKSVFVDRQRRTVVVTAGEMVAAERHATEMPDAATARSLLFVVDLTNASPGTAGVFTISNVRLVPRP